MLGSQGLTPHFELLGQVGGARRGRLVTTRGAVDTPAFMPVGTTTVRALEAVARPDGSLAPGAGWTDLTIVPGHEFRAVDALLTNFHLPRSSLLLLVSAFAGRERVLHAYAHAVVAGYRFYSYGDAMLITDGVRP